jgi:DNA-binding NtrC family response regulator
MIRVLLYSEDAALQPLLSSALGKEYLVSLTSRGEEVERQSETGGCDVVVLDLNSNARFVGERIESAREGLRTARAPWIVMADDTLRAVADQLLRLGAFGYCRRPPSIRDLRTMILQAQEQKPAPAPGRSPAAAASRDRLLGSSAAMQHIYKLIDSVKDVHVSVLVVGQSGTGKELVARAVHNLSANARKPFIAVPCGAIPETLMESELFGHERGAFTGSTNSRAGYLEQAEDGTVFFDEIGELSLFTQVKLLRVLQEREFSRLGGNRLIPLRARMIFATNRDLPEMVAQGKLREDLYYRMNVVSVQTPSLSEHAEDIPQIAEHFLHYYSEMFRKPMTAIESDALELLESYGWPGNVRELENVVQQAIILAPGPVVRARDLPLQIREQNVVRLETGAPEGNFEQQVRDFKLKLTENALRQHHGNKTLAARSLGISRAYLHRLLRNGEGDSVVDEVDRLSEIG